MPWRSNIANKFAKTAKPFGTRVPLTLRYALAIPSVSRSVGLTFLTSPATGTKEKLTTVFRVVKPAVGGVKLAPFPHGVSPVSVPLIALQQGIHGKPKGGDTLGLAVGNFS